MRETHANKIELGNMDGPVLTALISAMYGKLREIPSGIALPLFLAADAYQVQSLLCCLCMFRDIYVSNLNLLMMKACCTVPLTADACNMHGKIAQHVYVWLVTSCHEKVQCFCKTDSL